MARLSLFFLMLVIVFGLHIDEAEAHGGLDLKVMLVDQKNRSQKVGSKTVLILGRCVDA